MICSMCTGGGSLLKGRWRGSITLTPSPGTNHSFPSADLAAAAVVAGTGRVASHSIRGVENRGRDGLLRIAIQASNSCRAIRTRPQDMYKPDRMIVILQSPVNGVAGQSVPAGERGNAAVPDHG